MSVCNPRATLFDRVRFAADLPLKNSAKEKWSSLVIDPPRKTVPREIRNFALRGSVSARLAGTIAVNVTHVMVSSKSVETGAQFRPLPAAAVRWKSGKRGAFSKAALSPSFPSLHTAANSAGVRSASAE
jgi:hypothetical protein